MALNQCNFIGNLGRDAEVRTTPQGRKVANFSLAVTEKRKGASGEPLEFTEWINVVAWDNSNGNGLASVAERYFKKGTKLYISGRLKTRTWDNSEGVKQYRTEIVLDNFEFAGAPPVTSGFGGTNGSGTGSSYGQGGANYGGANGLGGGDQMNDDDLPF